MCWLSYPLGSKALAILMSVMKAPIEKLTRTTNDVPGRLVRVMAAVRDQKRAGGLIRPDLIPAII